MCVWYEYVCVHVVCVGWVCVVWYGVSVEFVYECECGVSIYV